MHSYWQRCKGRSDELKAPEKSIGGNVFNNCEGRLPETRDRIWYEADVNYISNFRNSDRILFSSDRKFLYTLFEGYVEDGIYKDDISLTDDQEMNVNGLRVYTSKYTIARENNIEAPAYE